MLRRFVRLLSHILAVGCAVTPLMAQNGTIRGTVADSGGTPLPNASLTVDGTELRASSGSRGDYELRGVPEGRRTVRVRSQCPLWTNEFLRARSSARLPWK